MDDILGIHDRLRLDASVRRSGQSDPPGESGTPYISQRQQCKRKQDLPGIDHGLGIICSDGGELA
jgi:hypothetical protein